MRGGTRSTPACWAIRPTPGDALADKGAGGVVSALQNGDGEAPGSAACRRADELF